MIDMEQLIADRAAGAAGPTMQEQADEAIARRPDIQAQWLVEMNARHMTETARASAHLEAMDADKRAKLEGEWK